jgi:hypothetical protein
MPPWLKWTIGVVGAFVAYQVYDKYRGPYNKSMTPVVREKETTYGGMSAEEFAVRVAFAYKQAMATGVDEDLEQLYDIWKKNRYTAAQLAAPNASGAREEFKRVFGLK